jgi:hypothetical protein
MYQRAPKVEAAHLEFDLVYDRAANAALSRLIPGMTVDLLTDRSDLLGRMVERTHNLGRQLASSNWWIVRAPDATPFVLGDAPVGTTASLGLDDSWRPILAQERLVVVLV